VGYSLSRFGRSKESRSTYRNDMSRSTSLPAKVDHGLNFGCVDEVATIHAHRLAEYNLPNEDFPMKISYFSPMPPGSIPVNSNNMPGLGDGLSGVTAKCTQAKRSYLYGVPEKYNYSH